MNINHSRRQGPRPPTKIGRHPPSSRWSDDDEFGHITKFIYPHKVIGGWAGVLDYLATLAARDKSKVVGFNREKVIKRVMGWLNRVDPEPTMAAGHELNDPADIVDTKSEDVR